MSLNGVLSGVIKIDDSKCVNCHQCIAACPVKYCNDASGDAIQINHDLCIGCGECLTACTHEARTIVDDFDKWINDLKKRQQNDCCCSTCSCLKFS